MNGWLDWLELVGDCLVIYLAAALLLSYWLGPPPRRESRAQCWRLAGHRGPCWPPRWWYRLKYQLSKRGHDDE